MEVIFKEDLNQLVGGIDAGTWYAFVNAVISGDFSSIPYGYSSSGGYSSGGYSSNGYNWGGFTNYLNDSYFMNSQLWVGSGYSSGGYASGGGGGYYVSPTYVAGTGSIGSTSVPPTDCVFQTLGWISAMMFGDQTHDANYYEQYYNFTHPSSGTNALYNYLTNSGGGVPPTELMNFLNTFFNATDYSGASTQFLTNYVTNTAGNQELIGVYKTPYGGLHMVNVTKIIGTEVHYWDEQNKKEGFVDMSKMESFIGIVK